VSALDVRYTRTPDEPARPVGRLVDEKGRIFFQYDEDWLRTGWSLSPFRLPFERGVFEHRDRSFGPLPGLFDDSLPDGWGLLLMDRHYRSLGRDPASLSPLERLAWLGHRTMGALTYHPPAPQEGEAEARFDLDELARQSQALLTGKSAVVLAQLLRAGGSPGGARPKVLVGYDARTDAIRSGEEDLPEGFEAWLVKFPANGEDAAVGATEYAYSLMAGAAGLEVPPARLFETPAGGRFFGIKRFDRDHNRRCHCHTFGNLIQANFRIPSCDYSDFLKVTALLTRDQAQVLKAFRWMTFNVFARNRDDHAKNFAFRLDDATGNWALTPAYDLTFSSGPGGEHAMTVLGEGRAPGPAHLLRLAAERDIARADAGRIVDEVRAAVSRWPDFAGKAGVPAAVTHELARGLG